jgi:hypothetical protein
VLEPDSVMTIAAFVCASTSGRNPSSTPTASTRAQYQIIRRYAIARMGWGIAIPVSRRHAAPELGVPGAGRAPFQLEMRISA